MYTLILQGHSGGARVRIRQYMDEFGLTAQPLFLMGLSYHQEKRYAKAIEWFQKATIFNETDDLYPPTWHFLGWSYFYQGDIDQSKHAFESFLQFHPNESDSMFALGLIALESGQLDEAITQFKKSLNAAQSDQNIDIQAKATSRLGDVYEERGQLLEALSQYDAAITLNPDLYETIFRKYTLLSRLEKQVEAERAFSDYINTRNRVRPDLQQTSFPE